MTEPMREGLPPVVAEGARILLLGSFPSEYSLMTGEYYANPRNQFWRLLASVCGFDADAPYEERIAAAIGHGVALWDVVHSCRRKGSMDVKMDRKTLRINDFGLFLSLHPCIERVYANGSTAFDLFGRHVECAPPVVRLPSSSGALPMSFADKLSRWRRLAGT